MDLQDFLKLAGKEGKVVIVSEDGTVKGVFLGYEEYQKISGGKSYDQQKEDIAEKVNREILQAQLEEVISPSDGGTIGTVESAERIDSLINKRAQDLFKSIPYNYSIPEVATNATDEEIKPNFDDI